MPLNTQFQAAQPAMAAAATASGTDRKAVIVCYLGGALDNHNTLTPRTGSNRAAYAAARGVLAIADNPATALNADWQLHPAMTGLKAIYDLGKLAVVQNVGTLVYPTTKAQVQANAVPLPPGFTSHSDQSALLQTGLADNPSALTGWAGRMMDLMAPSFNSGSVIPPSFSYGGPQQLFEASQELQLGSSAFGVQQFSGGGRVAAQVTAFMQNFFDAATESDPLKAEYVLSHKRARAAAGAVNAALAAQAVITVFPNTTLGNNLKAAVKQIKQMAALGHRRQVHFVSMGGFDQHASLLTDLNANLLALDPALKATYDALVELSLQNNVTFLVKTEFGRTLTINGSGTDHAWGGNWYAFGGAVAGGLKGFTPDLSLSGPNMMDTRGYLIPTTPMEDVYATLAKWMGVPDALGNGVNPLDLMLPNLVRFPGQRGMGFLP
jgi:uncharacterized protein (DUF1501 family)